LPQPARRRKRRPTAAAQPRVGASERRLRGEERDALIRAELEPLAPGERPLAVTIAAIVAAALAIANVVLWAVGWKVNGETPPWYGNVAFLIVMGAAAVGMWLRRYWAVLGFQALLAISIVYTGLALLLATNVVGAVICIAVLIPACVLFWFLIRAMARLQLPERPLREPGR
jgi:hypothetical protein